MPYSLHHGVNLWFIEFGKSHDISASLKFSKPSRQDCCLMAIFRQRWRSKLNKFSGMRVQFQVHEGDFPARQAFPPSNPQHPNFINDLHPQWRLILLKHSMLSGHQPKLQPARTRDRLHHSRQAFLQAESYFAGSSSSLQLRFCRYSAGSILANIHLTVPPGVVRRYLSSSVSIIPLPSGLQEAEGKLCPPF